MYELKLHVNSKTKSPNVVDIIKLSKKIGFDVNVDDERLYVVKTDKFDKSFVRLVVLSRELKGTKLLLNDIEIKNIDSIMNIYSCKREKFCKGECEYINYKWQFLIDVLLAENIDEIIKKYEMFHPIDERLFNLEEYPNIIITSDDEVMKIRKSELIGNFEGYSHNIELLCSVFKKEIYINKLINLPEEILLKKVSYSKSKEYKEKEEMEQGLQNLEMIIEKFGDEFEKRLRKVLDDYLKK
ncbi:MAG: hypothetical protein JEZ04_10110 [Spirochaetales bacterium]|nr:hypothetical protein [Spirochaetales bacterium]